MNDSKNIISYSKEAVSYTHLDVYKRQWKSNAVTETMLEQL